MEEKVIETNPEWSGYEDKDNPKHILSSISEEEYLEIPYDDKYIERSEFKCGWKQIQVGHIFPNNAIVENFEDVFEYEHNCDLNKLCLIEDEDWLDDEQLFGVSVLHHSTSEGGHQKVDEKRFMSAFGMKGQVAEMINQYGFNFKPEDIKLHQYIMSDI